MGKQNSYMTLIIGQDMLVVYVYAFLLVYTCSGC